MYEQQIAKELALFLLEYKAAKIDPNDPFTLASGLKSPIYCDTSIILSYPNMQDYIHYQLATLITAKFGKPDVIAGVATGDSIQGALVAEKLGLPFIYVRSEKKSHSMQNQIEGVINAGQSVVVINDLISTGESSLLAVDVLHEAGAEVKGMAAIFTYQMKTAKKNFEQKNCELVTLSNYETLIQTAFKNEYITNDDFKSLKKWHQNPESWSKK